MPWSKVNVRHSGEMAGLRSGRYIKGVGLCLVNRHSIPSVHEPSKLQAQFGCTHLLFFFFVQSGQQVSAISNVEPVETFCQGWFGDSCEDSSS